MEKPSLGTRRNLVAGVGEGVLATPWVFLSLPGSFIIAGLLTQYFGIGPVLFGVIVSLPAWANALQLLYLPIVAHFLTPRDMALGPSWLNLGLWLMLALVLPLLPREDPPGAARIFILFFLFASFCGSLIGVGWTGWVQTWVPSRIRGKYFGMRNRLIQVTTVGFLILAMFLLGERHEGIWAYQVLILIAVGMRFFSILWQHKIRAVERGRAPSPKQGWHRDLAGVWRHRPFRRFLAVTCWAAFWMNCVGPFSVVYSFEYLGVGKAMFAQISILATLSGAVFMPTWGRLADRYGCKRIIILSLTLWWLTGYAWAFLTPETRWVLYGTWVFGGAASGGFFIGTFNLLFKVVRKDSLTAGISLNLALSSVAAAIAPILVGAMIGYFASGSDEQILAYRVLFFVATTMVLLTGLLAHRIPESSRSIGEVSLLGTMRAMRLSMMTLGLGFVSNINPVHRRTKPKKPD